MENDCLRINNERSWNFLFFYYFYSSKFKGCLIIRGGGEEDKLQCFCRGKGSFHRAEILAMGSGKFIVWCNPHHFLQVRGRHIWSLLHFRPQHRLHPVDTVWTQSRMGVPQQLFVGSACGTAWGGYRTLILCTNLPRPVGFSSVYFKDKE